MFSAAIRQMNRSPGEAGDCGATFRPGVAGWNGDFSKVPDIFNQIRASYFLFTVIFDVPHRIEIASFVAQISSVPVFFK